MGRREVVENSLLGAGRVFDKVDSDGKHLTMGNSFILKCFKKMSALTLYDCMIHDYGHGGAATLALAVEQARRLD